MAAALLVFRPLTHPFCIVSDFDGVWTEPARERDRVLETLESELSRLLGENPTKVSDDCEEFTQAVLAKPSAYGWLIEGKLSSYLDEDAFALPSALGQFLEGDAHPRTHLYRDAILEEYPSVGEFLDDCYQSTGVRFRAEVTHDLAAGANQVLGWLQEQQVNVVFVTNAPTEKVVNWFSHYGFDVEDAADVDANAAPLRVHGRAGKQWLGDAGTTVDIGGRTLQADRPRYRAILEAESPDLVIGDVPSLDLAQPLALRLAGKEGAPRSVGLMHLPHTPSWALEATGCNPGDINHLLPHVTALPRIVAGEL